MASIAASPPSAPLPARPLWWLLLLPSVAATAAFVALVLQRVPYPFELEWMEGAMADHAARVARGLPVYTAPTPEHVPFLYAPLLFWLGALGIGCGLDGILALRLIAAISTLATAMLIGHWVRVETKRFLPGFAASGMFLAGYGWFWWWYDLARNDTLFVFLCLLTAFVLRHGPRWRWLLAALVATAAVLTKQSALMWLPAVGVGALVQDWRTALRFGVSCVVLMATALGALHVGSDGWSTFYLFTMPRHHGIVADHRLGFWINDVWPMLPLLLLGVLGFWLEWRRGRRGEALFLAAVGAGGMATSWLSRVHVGGFDNVLMYGFAAGCLLGPIAAADARLRWFGPLLLLAQFGSLGWLAWQREPMLTALPSAQHRQAHEELAAWVAACPGPVWIPTHGKVTDRAARGIAAHGQAIFDLLQLLPKLDDGMFDLSALLDRRRIAHLGEREQAAIATWLDSSAAALRERRFAAIVVDEVGAQAFPALFAVPLAGADGVPGNDDDPYVRAPGPVLRDPRAIAPLIGYPAHSPYALLPRRTQ
jgi:hypothetical protein